MAVSEILTEAEHIKKEIIIIVTCLDMGEKEKEKPL